MVRPNAFPFMNAEPSLQASRGPADLAAALGRQRPIPIIVLPHHENHAWFSWSCRPSPGKGARSWSRCSTAAATAARFRSISPMVGPCGCCSAMTASSIRSVCITASSAPPRAAGPMLSSEGRYMGAAAYGDPDRLTNPFYAALKANLQPGAGGSIASTDPANWPRRLFEAVYGRLIRILGAADRAEGYVESGRRARVEDIDHKARTRRSGSTRRRPRRWCSRTR